MQQGVSAHRKLWIATASAVAILVAAGVVATVVLGRGADRSSGGDSTGATPFGKEPAAQRPLVIAHRGASAYAPHDTVAAAQEAVRRGADAVEVDLRQTRDGRLVALFHGTLAPTTNVEQVYPRRSPWRVEGFSLREIRRLDAGSWFSAEFSGERVPTLTELTDSISGSDLRVIVEVKKPRRYPGVADRLLRELQSRPHRYAEVESFSVAFLRSFARRTPPVRLGYSGTFPAARLDKLATFADAVNAHKTIDRSYVELAHRHGLQVKVWSVNSEAGMQRALRLGVDGIYTHRPDVLRRLLGMRQPGE